MKFLEKLLRYHLSCHELQSQVFHVLTNMSKHGKNSVNEDSLIEAMFLSLLYHECHSDIVLAGLNAFGSLAFSRFDFGRWKDKLTGLILSFMRQYRNNPQFQIACCFAIAHLCYGKGIFSISCLVGL